MLALNLTSFCNLQCPECSMGTPRVYCPEHYDLPYIERAASYLYGVKELFITGGEPTMHPLFGELVPRFKTMFGCRELSLATNGYRLIEYADILSHFDHILIGRYAHNHKQVEFVQQLFPDVCQVTTMHNCTARRARHPKPCSIAHKRLKYAYGRLYPCCLIPGGMESIGIGLTDDWQTRIEQVPLPCRHCFLAEEDPNRATSASSKTAAAAGWSSSYDLPQECDVRWPARPDDILIFGLEVDSWMRREAEIRLRPTQGCQFLNIVFESHTPLHLHPLRLSFEDRHGATVHTTIIHQPGQGELRVPLSLPDAVSGEAWLTVHCTPTFIPQEFDANNPDRRELGIRVVSLRYA